MTFNQFNFMSVNQLVKLLFSGVEICVDTEKALDIRRFFWEKFPDKLNNIDFSSFDYCVYVKLI